jgi:hypothetical protein
MDAHATLTPPFIEPMCDLPTAFTPCEFRVKWADGAWEIDHAHRLRRAVFCVEQGIFVGDDRDVIDAQAQPLVDHGWRCTRRSGTTVAWAPC